MTDLTNAVLGELYVNISPSENLKRNPEYLETFPQNFGLFESFISSLLKIKDKVKSADKLSGPSGRSLSQLAVFLAHLIGF